jgi:hypothetical protein
VEAAKNAEHLSFFAPAWWFSKDHRGRRATTFPFLPFRGFTQVPCLLGRF